MLLGAHVSTAGGVDRAVANGQEIACEAIQVFTRNQRQWDPPPLAPAPVAAFRREARAAGYHAHAVSHASYLINLCSTNAVTRRRSRAALIDEVLRCAALAIPYLCMHPGSHQEQSLERGIEGIVAGLRAVLAATRGRRVKILLENTAGQGTNIGHRMEHLEELLRRMRSRRLGVCIDTCHLFAAGYDFRSPKAYEKTMTEIDRAVGLARVHAFHLNDSKHPLGARRDRHATIGEGEIGSRGFRHFVNDPRFADLPGILETPGGPDDYPRNLARLRRLRRRT